MPLGGIFFKFEHFVLHGQLTSNELRGLPHLVLIIHHIYVAIIHHIYAVMRAHATGEFGGDMHPVRHTLNTTPAHSYEGMGLRSSPIGTTSIYIPIATSTTLATVTSHSHFRTSQLTRNHARIFGPFARCGGCPTALHYIVIQPVPRYTCCNWIRTHNLSRQSAADLSLRPRSHWDRRRVLYRKGYFSRSSP